MRPVTFATGLALALGGGLAGLPGPCGPGPDVVAAQTPTRVVVRAVANDAKLIGSGVGGARIVIRDAASGAVLAEGVQEGSTGDTEAIMSPDGRAPVFDTPGAAAFEATIPLQEPTLVQVEAEGPLHTPDHLRRASKTLLLVPGQHLTGEGVIVVLNGFTVEILEPAAGAEIDVGRGDGAVPVRARVTMLCGCPTEPGGLWDADRIEVVARLVMNDEVVTWNILRFAGETSTYAGSLDAPAPGAYRLEVVAIDVDRANTGIAFRPVTVSR